MDSNMKELFRDFSFNNGDSSAMQIRINNILLPLEYIDFLKKYNGGEGSIGENAYLELWKYADLLSNNEAYDVKNCLTDSCLIGTNLGGEMYGIDVSGNYFAVPDIPMNDEEKIIIGSSFKEFIEGLNE